MLLSTYVLFFFFFQAEDGIRYSSVTGVQTCALPICITIDLEVDGYAYSPAYSLFFVLKVVLASRKTGHSRVGERVSGENSVAVKRGGVFTGEHQLIAAALGEF